MSAFPDQPVVNFQNHMALFESKNADLFGVVILDVIWVMILYWRKWLEYAEYEGRYSSMLLIPERVFSLQFIKFIWARLIVSLIKLAKPNNQIAKGFARFFYIFNFSYVNVCTG